MSSIRTFNYSRLIFFPESVLNLITEQKMIENLALHGVVPQDLVPALMTTHTVANPEYDPVEAKRQEKLRKEKEADNLAAQSDDISETTLVEPQTPSKMDSPSTVNTSKLAYQTTARVLEETTASQIPG